MTAKTFKYVLMTEGEGDFYLDWEGGLTSDLMKARFSLTPEKAKDAFGAAETGHVLVPRKVLITAEVFPEQEESYGSAVKGDPYPKHWDML